MTCLQPKGSDGLELLSEQFLQQKATEARREQLAEKLAYRFMGKKGRLIDSSSHARWKCHRVSNSSPSNGIPPHMILRSMTESKKVTSGASLLFPSIETLIYQFTERRRVCIVEPPRTAMPPRDPSARLPRRPASTAGGGLLFLRNTGSFGIPPSPSKVPTKVLWKDCSFA